jgi:hypothetical protein
VYSEDASGGFFTLHSGAAIVDANGQTIARATLEDVLAQVYEDGAGFTLTQSFSPSSRGVSTKFRAEVPYLTKIVDGRVVILDHGVKQADGTWTLASNPATSFATAEDILKQPHAIGTAWTIEEIGFNPYADVPVENIGIYFLDGKAIDYTVEVTDDRGAFYVWARNLDYAMELQQLQGHARGYNLRNFEVKFFGLDEVGSSDNSKVRVELLTPGQFQFATQLFGVEFRPQMLSATYANTTGQLSYTINQTGQYRADSLDGTQQSDIKTILNLLDNVMDTYVTASRAFAARIALQGGLKDFMAGIKYDVESDKYLPTSGREMVPMFEEIFRHAPDGYEPTRDYLMDWAEILWQVYPDYIPDGSKNQYGMRLAVNQPYIVQMALAAYENVPVDADVPAILDALGVNEERLKDGAGDGAVITGTAKQDYFYLNGGVNIQPLAVNNNQHMMEIAA